MKDMPFSIDMAAELANLKLPELRVLHLMGSSLTAASVSELARADWPCLCILDLGHNDLDAMAVLFGVGLEKVQRLKCDAHVFAKVSVRRMHAWPPMGLWPNLSCITISRGNVHLTL